MNKIMIVVALIGVMFAGCAFNQNAYELIEIGMTVDEVLYIMDGWLVPSWHESSDGYLSIWFGDYTVKVEFLDRIVTDVRVYH